MNPVIMRESRVKTPSAIVQIERCSLSVVQQKVTEAMVIAVSQGITQIPDEKDYAVAEAESMGVIQHVVSISDLKHLIGYKSKDNATLYEAVIGLRGKTVDYNIFGKDPRGAVKCPGCGEYAEDIEPECPKCGHSLPPVKTSTLTLSSVLFDTIATHQGKIYFSFGRLLTYYLNQSQEKFFLLYDRQTAIGLKRKGSYALYLNALDYINPNTGFGYLPIMDAKMLVKLLGSGFSPEKFYEIERKLIEPCIEEINKNTNITIVYEKEKVRKASGKGRMASGIRFFAKMKQVEKPQIEDSRLIATIDGVEIWDLPFAEWLTNQAAPRNKSAYQRKILQAIRDDEIERQGERMQEYAIHLAAQAAAKEAERKQRLLEQSYQKWMRRVNTTKGVALSIENLYVWAENGFVVLSGMIDKKGMEEFLKEPPAIENIYTREERNQKDAKDTRRYSKWMLNSLKVIAPLEEWSVRIGQDGESRKVMFRHEPNVFVLRAVDFALEAKKHVMFETKTDIFEVSAFDRENAKFEIAQVGTNTDAEHNGEDAFSLGEIEMFDSATEKWCKAKDDIPGFMLILEDGKKAYTRAKRDEDKNKLKILHNNQEARKELLR